MKAVISIMILSLLAAVLGVYAATELPSAISQAGAHGADAAALGQARPPSQR